MTVSLQNNQWPSKSCSSTDVSTARSYLLDKWLTEIDYKGVIEKIAGDASSKQFYRFKRMHGKTWHTAIIVDAAPPHENIEDLAKALNWLHSTEQLKFPEIYAINVKEGFALIEDFGDELVLNKLRGDEKHYENLIIGLLQMQTAATCASLPLYSKELLLSEMSLFEDWVIGKHLNWTLSDEKSMLLETVKYTVADKVLQQRQCIVHRDFHSKNILVLDKRYGVVDFQDVCQGAYTYDLASLLRDAYTETKHLDAWLYFFFKNGAYVKDFSTLQEDFHWTCIQRQLKVAGIFYRLWLRDGKDNYLQYVPRVLDYLLASIRMVSLDDRFAALVQDVKNKICKQ